MADTEMTAYINFTAHLENPYDTHGWNPVQIPEHIVGSAACNAYTASGWTTWVWSSHRVLLNRTEASVSEIIAIARELVSLGYGFFLEVSGVPQVKGMKMIGHKDIQKVGYKVNGSTGERNETGEKRMTRALNNLEKIMGAEPVAEPVAEPAPAPAPVAKPVKITQPSEGFACRCCGKVYGSRQGRYNHEKKCE